MEQLDRPRHIKIGSLGEAIAAKYLVSKGQQIIDRNYRRKWGEIDIVSRETDGKIHFVEVKTVSYETLEDLKAAVARRTFRPEENVHEKKLQRLYRTIEAWLADRQVFKESWQIDVIAVRIVPREKYAKVTLIESIVET